MTAAILPCGSQGPDFPGSYTDAVERVSSRGSLHLEWSMGSLGNLPPRSDVWLLMRTDAPQADGIVGHGITTTAPYREDPGASGYVVQIDFDVLLPPGDGLLLATISDRFPDYSWPFKAPLSFPADHESGLRELWAGLRVHYGLGVTPLPGALPATALARTLANRYEHDAEAVRIAVAHHGTACRVCGFDFQVTYGPAGADLVAMHHVVPPSHLNAGYRLDPIADLIPLCGNCHLIAHQRQPDPFLVSELRELIAGAGHLTGAVMTDQQLEAEEAAARLAAAD